MIEDPIIQDIEGYGNIYQISENGEVYNKITGRELSTNNLIGGYKSVKIDKKSPKIHILLAKTFIDNKENKPLVDHIDRNPLNNDLKNLRWVNHSENCINSSRKNEKSGYVGVYKMCCYGAYYWVANISLKKTRITKCFEHTEEGLKNAIQQRKYWERIYFGNYCPREIDENVKSVVLKKKPSVKNLSGEINISKTLIKNSYFWRFFKKINKKVYCKDFPFTEEGLKDAIIYKNKVLQLEDLHRL